MSKVDDALICKANQSGVQNLVNANNPRSGFQHLTGAAFSEKGGIKLKAKKYDYNFLFHPFFGAKNGWSLRNMPTYCTAHTETKLNPSLITRSPYFRKNHKQIKNLENNYGLLKQMRLIVV